MARKITIRRVGGYLPATCLMALVLLVSIFIWLSTFGLPQRVLRGIEAEAAKGGIYLHIGKLRLSPSAGLALRAHDVTLYADKGDEVPLARVYKATVGINVMALLRGELSPHMLQLHGAEVSLPSSDEGQCLRLTEGNISATIHNNELLRLTSASLKLGGVPVYVRGSYRQPRDEQPPGGTGDESSPLDLRAGLCPYQKHIDTLQRILAQQAWTPESPPRLDLNISNERGLQLTVQAHLPHLDYEQFRLEGVELNLAYQKNAVTINILKFNTVEPVSAVSIQGNYDIGLRRLSFSLESTAALGRMAEALDIPGSKEWLALYRHGNNTPPSVSLRGDIALEEDYSPKSITLQGRLRQEQFSYGSTQVEKMGLSFFYQDGDFNLEELNLRFPEGSLRISASASGQDGKGRARIQADMAIEQLLHVISEFTGTNVTLPEGMALEGHLQCESEARLSMPPFHAGQTDWRLYVPSLESLKLSLSVGQMTYQGNRLTHPALALSLQDIRHDANLIPDAVKEASLTFTADSAQLLPGEDAPPVEFTGADFFLGLTGLVANKQQLSLEHAHGQLKFGSLRLGELLQAGSVNLQLPGLDQLRPLEANWRRMLQKGQIHLTASALHCEGEPIGDLDSSLSLDESGLIDLKLNLQHENNKLGLNLQPRLQEDGLLVLDEVTLELPAAGFEALLSLTDTHITHIRLPELISLDGNLSIDTARRQLHEANATIRIPHLVRTPGAVNKVLEGKEIPLALEATVTARRRDDGEVDMDGTLLLTHKEGTSARPDNRTLELSYRADTQGLIRLSGTNTIDITTIDSLIDDDDAHSIMRDFRVGKDTRTRVLIDSLTIDCRRGLEVQADCDLDMTDFEFQLGAVEDAKDSRGQPTGREMLRKDLGPNPFASLRSLKGKVKVHYRDGASDDEGGQLPDLCQVTITNADINYDNRPWLRRKKLKGGPAESRLQGAKVVIDIEDGFVQIFDVRGKVYPDYSLGMFYDDLHSFLDIFSLPQPASVETAHCLFPIYSDCKRDMEGSIRMMAGQANLHFLHTTFPLRAFSGFICLREGSVYLDRLNAACWDGAINAAINIDYSGKRTGFDGLVEIHNMNLSSLAASYGSEQAPALCNGNIRFRTPTPEVRDLEAYGEVHIVDGDLMSLSLFRPVGELITDLPGYFTKLEEQASGAKGKKPGWISRQANALFGATGRLVDDVGDGIGAAANNIPFANHFLRYDLQEAHSHFVISNGWLRTRQCQAMGYNLDVSTRLAISLDDLEIKGNIWPQISSVPTIILSPLTFLSRYVVDINLYGSAKDIQWRFGLDKRLQDDDAPTNSATDKPSNNKFKPRRP